MEKDNLAKKVSERIEKEHIKIRSKYTVAAQKLGLGSALVLTIILAIIAINLFLYWLDVTNNLGVLSLGNRGLLAFLESFPYIPFIGAIVLIVIASFILKKFDISYRAPLLVAVGLLIALPILGGLGVRYSGINERIEAGVERGEFAPLKPVYGLHAPVARKHTLVGTVNNTNNNILNVQVGPKTIDVQVDDEQEVVFSNFFKPGDWIRAIGILTNNTFYADVIFNLTNHRDARLGTPGLTPCQECTR